MKFNRSTWVVFIIMIVVAGLYRAWDGRPFGFAPQIAIAIFGGALISDKRIALFLPVVSLLISDIVYEILYLNGLSTIPGFYKGQVVNYILFAGLTCFGFLMKKVSLLRIAGFSLTGSLLYFIVSNFTVWIAGAGFARPRTFEGLMLCYNDAIVFYRDYGLVQGFAGNIFLGDLFFSAVLFGAYYLVGLTSPSKYPSSSIRS